jgi:hypothetical protein
MLARFLYNAGHARTTASLELGVEKLADEVRAVLR